MTPPGQGEITAIHYRREQALRFLGGVWLILTPDGRAQREVMGTIELGRFGPDTFSQLAARVVDVGFFEFLPKYVNSNVVLDGGSEVVRVQLGRLFWEVVSGNRAGPPGLLLLLKDLSSVADGIAWGSDQADDAPVDSP